MSQLTSLCSPCRRSIFLLPQAASRHVSVRHSSLSAIHRGLRSSEKTRPQGFRPGALNTASGSRPPRSTSRMRAGDPDWKKPTYTIRKGKMDITDKGPQPKSRAKRFNDPGESFGKKSLVYQLKHGDLREKIAGPGEEKNGSDRMTSSSKFSDFEAQFAAKSPSGQGAASRDPPPRQRKYAPAGGTRSRASATSERSFGSRPPRNRDSEPRGARISFDKDGSGASPREHKGRVGFRDGDSGRRAPSFDRPGAIHPPRDLGGDSRGRQPATPDQQPSSGYERRVADRETRFMQGEDLPVRIHHTTAASQFLYGYSVVEAALKTTKRKLYNLYLYSGPDRQNVSQDTHLEKLAHANGIPVHRLRDSQGLRMMDKMSERRPHNGCVLESSPLPQLPLKALGPMSDDPARPGFSVELSHQSAEEVALNGSPDFVPFRAPGRDRKPFILLLDGILDPGNLGAILRSAAFLGVTGVAITKYNSAPLSPVAIKASASASEVLPLYSVDSTLGFLQLSKENGWMVYASVAAGPRSKGNSHVTLDRVEKYDPLSQQPTILIVGSEGEGLGKQIRRAADFEVSIPGASGLLSTVDSLNVSVATGILCSSFLKKSQDLGIDQESFVDVPENDEKLW